MFEQISKSSVRGVGAWLTNHQGAVFHVAGNNEKNGRIDPAYLLLAYAFDKKLQVNEIFTTHDQSQKWKTASDGLIALANSVEIPLRIDIKQKSAPKDLIGTELSLVPGSAVIEQSPLQGETIFTPNANGYFNIPRLYLLAALAIEQKQGAAVTAFIVNKHGLIVATGIKSYGEGGCQHAEMRALFALKGHLPDQCMIFSTLKPCNMCAGLIQALVSESDQQFWARDDPSAGANHALVPLLSLRNGRAMGGAAKDSTKVRGIRLIGKENSFTESFMNSWSGRQRAATKQKDLLPERIGEALKKWCDTQIQRQTIMKGNGWEVKLKNSEAAIFLKNRCSSIDEIVRQANSFEMKKQGAAKWEGMKKEGGEIIKNSIEMTSIYREATKAARWAENEADMGIIQYISDSTPSKALQNAARDTLKAKLLKYRTRMAALNSDSSEVSSASTGSDKRMTAIATYIDKLVVLS